MNDNLEMIVADVEALPADKEYKMSNRELLEEIELILRAEVNKTKFACGIEDPLKSTRDTTLDGELFFTYEFFNGHANDIVVSLKENLEWGCMLRIETWSHATGKYSILFVTQIYNELSSWKEPMVKFVFWQYVRISINMAMDAIVRYLTRKTKTGEKNDS